jgi:hypothetical protein
MSGMMRSWRRARAASGFAVLGTGVILMGGTAGATTTVFHSSSPYRVPSGTSSIGVDSRGGAGASPSLSD